MLNKLKKDKQIFEKKMKKVSKVVYVSRSKIAVSDFLITVCKVPLVLFMKIIAYVKNTHKLSYSAFLLDAGVLHNLSDNIYFPYLHPIIRVC